MKREVAKLWEPGEDMLILELIKQYGRKWGLIKLFLAGRSTSSIRNRWLRMQKSDLPKRAHICKMDPRKMPPLTSPCGEFYNLSQDLPMVSMKDSELMMENVRREQQLQEDIYYKGD
jgi:hypothetical protein